MDSLARGITGIIFAASLAASPLVGQWALPNGKPLAAAEMRVTQLPDGRTSLDIFETTGQMTAPIRAYDVDMTKLMHMIVISDDFAQFMHVHPTFDPKTGHFTQVVRLEDSHRYYVYADAEPRGLGQQVFRFSLQPGTRATTQEAARPAFTPSPLAVAAGPYQVALAKTTLAAGKPQTIAVTITRSGRPATDLHPYLGAAAHAVFIDTTTLAYVHVHPTVAGAPEMDMDMPGMHMDSPAQAGPHMNMHVGALAAGSYKLWLQFEAGSALYVAPFTLAVR